MHEDELHIIYLYVVIENPSKSPVKWVNIVGPTVFCTMPDKNAIHYSHDMRISPCALYPFSFYIHMRGNSVKPWKSNFLHDIIGDIYKCFIVHTICVYKFKMI